MMTSAQRHGTGRLSRAIGMSSVLVLLLAGCGAQDTPETPAAGAETESDAAQMQAPESDTEAAAPQTEDGPASGQVFVEAFEHEGLECTQADANRFGPGVTDQYVCQGEDHLVMSIRDYEDADARDEQLGTIEGLACEIAEQGQEIQRVTVSDTWIVMAGGDRDVDFEVFGNAMTGLGLEWTDYTC